MSKICFIIPTLSQGGMERVLCELANYSVKRGFHVTVLCLFKKEIKYSLEKAVQIISPEFDYEPSFIMKLRVLKYLYTTVKKVSPDTILSFGEIFNALAVIAGKLLGKKVFISDRSSPLVSQGIVTGLLKRIVYPHADGIIAQTDFAKGIFKMRKYNRNIVVIPNPLRELKNFKYENNDENKVIVSVGRITPSKNQADLIRLFKEINKVGWKLYIVGDGPLINELHSLIESLDLKDRVILVGPSNDVDSWLQKADIFAYTSLTEGFPNALSEAVAFPLATIAYDCIAGPSDIIEHNYNGLLIPLNNKDLFRKKLELLMDNKELRIQLKENGLLNRSKFSVDSVGEQYLCFITKELDQKARS